MRPTHSAPRSLAYRLAKGLPLLCLGALLLVLGLVALPATLMLLFLRDKLGIKAKAVVVPHEALGCLLWVGLSTWIHGIHELSA